MCGDTIKANSIPVVGIFQWHNKWHSFGQVWTPAMLWMNHTQDSLLIHPKYLSCALQTCSLPWDTHALNHLDEPFFPRTQLHLLSDYSVWTRLMVLPWQPLIRSSVVLEDPPILYKCSHMGTTKFKLVCLASSSISCWLFLHQSFHSIL